MPEIFNRSAEKLGWKCWLYRKVPVNKDDIGYTALTVETEMDRYSIACPIIFQSDNFERKLFISTQLASHTINETVRKMHRFFMLHRFLIK